MYTHIIYNMCIPGKVCTAFIKFELLLPWGAPPHQTPQSRPGGFPICSLEGLNGSAARNQTSSICVWSLFFATSWSSRMNLGVLEGGTIAPQLILEDPRHWEIFPGSKFNSFGAAGRQPFRPSHIPNREASRPTFWGVWQRGAPPGNKTVLKSVQTLPGI